jgi:ATP-dependent Clp protease ATP-binding subunit ClpA
MAAKIARKALAVLQNRLSEKNIAITARDDALDYIAKKGFSVAYGAREIIRLVEGPVKEKIVEALLSGGLEDGAIELVLEDDEIAIIVTHHV